MAAVAATVVLSAGVLHASSLTISPEAARVGAYGLALRIEDPATAPPAATWVGIGPEKGLNAEIALLGRFWIDPASLSAARASGRLAFLFLRPSIAPEAESVRFFLVQTGQAWHLGAETWNDLEQRWVDAGSGRLNAEPSASSGVRIEFEWGAASSPAGNDGYLRVFRSQDEASDARVPLFAAERLRNGSQRISHLQVGLVQPETQPSGAAGTLYFDDLALYRGPAPDPPEGEDVEPPADPQGPPPHAGSPSAPTRRKSPASGTKDERRATDVSTNP